MGVVNILEDLIKNLELYDLSQINRVTDNGKEFQIQS